MYRTLLTRGGRIVFEVAVDYSQTAHTWKEMLRLWVCALPSQACRKGASTQAHTALILSAGIQQPLLPNSSFTDSKHASHGHSCKLWNSDKLPDVQVITLDHEKYECELNNIAQGHSKSVQARDNMKLRAMGTANAAKCDLSTRLPKVYEALGEETGALKTTCFCIPTLTSSGIFTKTSLPYRLGLIPHQIM